MVYMTDSNFILYIYPFQKMFHKEWTSLKPSGIESLPNIDRVQGKAWLSNGQYDDVRKMTIRSR